MSSPNSEECLKDSSIKSCGKGLKNRGTAPNARSECREKSVSEILNAASWVVLDEPRRKNDYRFKQLP